MSEELKPRACLWRWAHSDNPQHGWVASQTIPDPRPAGDGCVALEVIPLFERPAALKDRDVVLEEAAERAAFVAGYRAAHMVPDAYDSTSAAEEAWEGYRLVSRALKGRV